MSKHNKGSAFLKCFLHFLKGGKLCATFFPYLVKKDFFALVNRRRKTFFSFLLQSAFSLFLFSFFFLSPMSENAISRWNVQLLRTSAVFPDKSSSEKNLIRFPPFSFDRENGLRRFFRIFASRPVVSRPFCLWSENSMGKRKGERWFIFFRHAGNSRHTHTTWDIWWLRSRERALRIFFFSICG